MVDDIIIEPSNNLSNEINTEISQNYSVICLSKYNCINPYGVIMRINIREYAWNTI